MAVAYHCARCHSLATPNQTLLIVYHQLGVLALGVNDSESAVLNPWGGNMEPSDKHLTHKIGVVGILFLISRKVIKHNPENLTLLCLKNIFKYLLLYYCIYCW